MATFFQQMADTLLAQAQAQIQPLQGKCEIEKREKPMGQSSNSQLGKRKEFEEPRTHEYDRGKSSRQKQSRTNQQRIRSSYPICVYEVCGKLHGDIRRKATRAYYNCGERGHFARDCTRAHRSTL